MDNSYSIHTGRDWKKARQAAFVQDVLAVIGQRPADLSPFEGVRERLQLRGRRYLGLQDVPLDRIAVMKDGQLHAYDTPEGVYNRPRTLFMVNL